MVRTSQFRLVVPRQDEDTETWLSRIAGHYAQSDIERLRRALEFVAPLYGDHALASGEPLLPHALGTAAILAELKLDSESLAAALLAPSYHLIPDAAEQLRVRHGAAAAELAEGVSRMTHIETLSSRSQANLKPDEQAAQLEALRKMLLAMVQDIRVVLIKLADHTQALRFAVKSDDADARRFTARLATDLFAPLANRLGVWQLKWEMEDHAFRILEPATYMRTAQLLDGKRSERERYIETVASLLRGELNRAGIAAEVAGRPKHIFSIYRKMREKDVDFESLYDVRAVRVLVQDVADCYAALGLVHQLWPPIPGEFDDYIARPKNNQYRSLHTAVIGPESKALEIQIRTRDMHQHAELGVAAHWRYKEGTPSDRGYDRKIAWLRQILEWKDAFRDAGELAEEFRRGLFEDTIYVLTPQGRVIALPKGATPVDFAYHVHSELGHRCRGAKVDGAIVPLNTPLANGQQVEILTARAGGPSRDWLNASLGYVRSASARARIRQWFNRQNHEQAVAHGRAVVEKELRRLGMTALNLDRLAAHFGASRLEDFLAEAGRGEIGQRQLQDAVHALAPRVAPRGAPAPADGIVQPLRPRPTTAAKSGVLVVGVDRLLTVPAGCCKPAPPDAIVGFVTVGRGVTIHRADCVNLTRLRAERRVTAEWGETSGATFAVDIQVEAANRAGVMREISEAVVREKARVTGSRSSAGESGVRLRYTIEVADLGQLQRVLTLIREIRGVARAVRR